MKKIIYSLVIMIAAGSLFTSCVTNTEPQGIKDLREAKADYIESLKNLKDAEAARAKAALAYDEANWAYELQIKEMKVEIERVKADAKIADKEAAIAAIVAQAKIDAVEYERLFAIAETNLQNTLDSIAVVSSKLSKEEKDAVQAYTKAYHRYLEAVENVHAKEAALYDQVISTEEAHQAVRKDSSATVAQIAYFEELLKNLPDSGESINQVEEIKAKLDAQQLELDYARANYEKEWNLYKSTNLKDNIKGFADGLIDYVAQNAALPAPFIMNFKTKLPDNEQVCELMKKYIVKYRGSFDGPNFLNFVNSVNVQEDGEGNYWLVANAYNAPAARALIWGYDFNDGSDYGSVASLVEALNRDLVVDSTRWRGIDSTGIKAAVAKAEAEYKLVEDTLRGIKNGKITGNGIDDYRAYNDAVSALSSAAVAGVVDLEPLKTAVKKAREQFYKNIYCRFWGIPYEALNTVCKFGFDTDKVCFKNPDADSLEITFSLKEFTEPTPIVNFDFEAMAEEADKDGNPFLPYKDGRFYIYDGDMMVSIDWPFSEIDGEFLKDNYQYYIVADQMEFNQFWKLDTDYFGYSALSHLLYKKAVLAYVERTADTQGTKEALAALQNEVLPSLEAAYYAADDAQSKNSEAFYKFVSGLVGQEFLDEICARLDSACAKAAGFIPAIVIPDDIFTKGGVHVSPMKLELQRILDYAQIIASGEQPSKKLLISIFEDIMCGEFNSINTRILSLILTLTDETDDRTDIQKIFAWFGGETKEDAGSKMFVINTAYTAAYMALQLGDAFAGDQFRALLSEVFTAYINTRIDLVKSHYPDGLTTAAFGKVVLADYDNVIEAVLFGTERYYELYRALFLDKYTPGTSSQYMDAEKDRIADITADIQARELVLNPSIDAVLSSTLIPRKGVFNVFLRLCGIVSVKHLVNDFSGVLGTLADTYFTEWREKWEEYDLKMAEFDAQQEAIAAASAVYGQYSEDISGLINFERGIYAQLYGDVVYDFDDDEIKDLAKEDSEVAQKQRVEEMKNQKAKGEKKTTSGLYAQLEDIKAFIEKIEAGYDGKTLWLEKVQHELEEAQAALEVATKRLELATQAYEQVLANHGVEDVPEAE